MNHLSDEDQLEMAIAKSLDDAAETYMQLVEQDIYCSKGEPRKTGHTVNLDDIIDFGSHSESQKKYIWRAVTTLASERFPNDEVIGKRIDEFHCFRVTWTKPKVWRYDPCAFN